MAGQTGQHSENFRGLTYSTPCTAVLDDLMTHIFPSWSAVKLWF